MGWLKHAFHIEEAADIDPTMSQQQAVDWVAHQIAKRSLTTPGLVFLGMCQPFNYVASQLMHFLQPTASVMTPDAFYQGYKNFATFLGHRGSIEYLCRHLETIEGDYQQGTKGIGHLRRRKDERKTKNGK